MYYILNALNHPEGPYPADWVRSNARAETLVSSGQTWIKYSAHPDFGPMLAAPPPPPAHFAFQHPLDVAAVRILSHTPGLDMLAKFISGNVTEKLMNIQLVGHSVRVDERQYPRIHELFLTAARRLEITRLPELYVKQGGNNAFSVGIEKYYVVLETGLLDMLEEDELLAVLAHELGHVKCDHMKYLTMVSMLRQFGQTMLDLISLPLAPALLMGVEAALVQWYQKSELSADRAALLVTKDIAVVQRMLGKLAGYSSKYCESLDMERLKQQATQFEEIGTGSMMEKALKVWSTLQETHPVPVLRIREIGEWAGSPEYQTVAGASARVTA